MHARTGRRPWPREARSRRTTGRGRPHRRRSSGRRSVEDGRPPEDVARIEGHERDLRRPADRRRTASRPSMITPRSRVGALRASEGTRPAGLIGPWRSAQAYGARGARGPAGAGDRAASGSARRIMSSSAPALPDRVVVDRPEPPTRPQSSVTPAQQPLDVPVAQPAIFGTHPAPFDVDPAATWTHHLALVHPEARSGGSEPSASIDGFDAIAASFVRSWPLDRWRTRAISHHPRSRPATSLAPAGAGADCARLGRSYGTGPDGPPR